MVAATCFFVMKSQSVFPLEDIIERRCTGYFGRRSALREFCVLYKYIDWLIAVPLHREARDGVWHLHQVAR